jgi:hypothetical protein
MARTSRGRVELTQGNLTFLQKLSKADGRTIKVLVNDLIAAYREGRITFIEPQDLNKPTWRLRDEE